MRIRRATTEEAGAIAAVHIASWRAAYRGHMPDAVLDPLDLEQRTGQWREILTSPGVESWVADAPPVVGFCTLHLESQAIGALPPAEITGLYLHPDHWRRGAGRKLTRAAVARAGEAGCGRVVLWVLLENRSARLFYEALGFRRDGEERTDTALAGRPLRLVRYALELE